MCIRRWSYSHATNASEPKTLSRLRLAKLHRIWPTLGLRQEAFALAEPVPDGPTTQAWLEAARRHGAVIVAGICERAGDALYNSAAVIGPQGFIGSYRKVHLWGAENLFFEPGDLGVPVWKTQFGRMAVAICYDGWFPETYRLAALQGAGPVLALLYLAWIGTALISIAMQFVRTAVVGEAVPAGVTFGALLGEHWEMLLRGVAPLLVAAGYASLAAVVTRSTLASFIIALVLITFDELLGKLVAWFSGFGMEWLGVPYQILPGYHLDNFASWMQMGVGHQVRLAGGTVIAWSHPASEAMLVAWVVGLLGLTLWLFRRQDIN